MRWPENNEIPVLIKNVGLAIGSILGYIDYRSMVFDMAWYRRIIVSMLCVTCGQYIFFCIHVFSVFVAWSKWKGNLLQCSQNVWIVRVTCGQECMTEGARTVTRSEYTPEYHTTLSSFPWPLSPSNSLVVWRLPSM